MSLWQNNERSYAYCEEIISFTDKVFHTEGLKLSSKVDIQRSAIMWVALRAYPIHNDTVSCRITGPSNNLRQCYSAIILIFVIAIDVIYTSSFLTLNWIPQNVFTKVRKVSILSRFNSGTIYVSDCLTFLGHFANARHKVNTFWTSIVVS